MADNTRELLVRVSATTELLRSQLTSAEQSMRQFERTAQVANDNVNRSFQRGAVSAGQMRFAMRDLSAQLGDIGTQFSLGARPMQIFASQGSQVAGAIGLMAGEATALGRFLGGPWFQILTTAAIVLGPFVAKLFEGEGAMKAVTAASNGMSDAQSLLGGIFDTTTGKIKSQNEMLLLNARIMAVNLRAEASAKRDASVGTLNDASLGREGVGYQLANPFRTRDQLNSGGKRARSLQTTVANVQSGRTSYSAAAKWAETFNFTGLTVDRGQFLQAISDRATAEGKRKIADLIDQSLNSGALAPTLRTAAKGPARTRTAGRSSSGSGDVDPLTKYFDNADSQNSQGLSRAMEERVRLLGKAAEEQWSEQRKQILQSAEYEYDQRVATEEKLRSVREAQLGTLSGLYEDLFRGGTKAIWDDFKQIGLRVVAQVLAKFTLAKLSGDNGGFNLGSAISAAIPAILGFADGGRPPLGRVSVVGERGPELFVPDVAGTIVPNHALGGSGQQIVINMPNASQETVAMVRREILNAAPMIVAAANGSTMRQMNRRSL